MPKIRLFRLSDKGVKTSKTLEEYVADRLAENVPKEEESPIVRENNGKPVKENRKHQDVETYLARIAHIMTEMGQKDDLEDPNKGITLENLETPSSSEKRTTVSSSYLAQALSESGAEEAALSSSLAVSGKRDPPATGNSIAKPQEQDDSGFTTAELLAMVKAKIKEYEPEPTTKGSSDSEGHDDIPKKSPSDEDSKGKTVEGIIEALSRVKIAISESQSQRSEATPVNFQRKSGRMHFTLSSQAMKARRNRIKSVLEREVKQRTGEETDSMNNFRKKGGLRQKLRSPRPPKSPVIKSPPAKSEKFAPSTPSLKASRLDGPNMSPDGASLIPNENQSPSSKSPHLTVQQQPRQTPVEGSATESPSTTTKYYAPPPTLALDIPSSTEERVLSPTLGVLSLLSHDGTAFEVEAHPVPLDSKTKRAVDDILKWTDESQVLANNRDLTPKHVPRDGPAWGFLNGTAKRKKKLLLQPHKAIQALRKSIAEKGTFSPKQPTGVHSNSLISNNEAADDAATKPDPPPSNSSTPKGSQGELSNFRNEPNLNEYVESLNEMEEYIKDAERGSKLFSEDDEKNFPHDEQDYPHDEHILSAESTNVKLSASQRVNALMPLLDTTRSVEGVSVACSRSTVPVANKAKPNANNKSLSTTNEKPSAIVEFNEEQLEAGRSESFSTYNATSDYDLDTDDEPSNDEGILSDDDFLSGESGLDEIDSPVHHGRKSQSNNNQHILEMSFSRSIDSRAPVDDDDDDDIRSISDLSAAVMEETAAVAKELRLEMGSMKKWLCFL